MLNEPQTRQALDLAAQRYSQRLASRPRSFVDISQLGAAQLRELLRRGQDVKRHSAAYEQALNSSSLALLFQKTSTRTRCSFESAARELGMSSSYIAWENSNFLLADLQDEVKVLSRFYDCVVARVHTHSTLETMASHSEVPVINGLSDRTHPCQALADFLTMQEYFGDDLGGLEVAYIGDSNNVCRSLLEGAVKLGVRVRVSSPAGFRIDLRELDPAQELLRYVDEPSDCVNHADVVYTDTWVSMGQEADLQKRLDVFAPYQVNMDLMGKAPRHALFMHCLPAHPDQEVTAEVLRSYKSLVFDQAENRKHAQKAILLEYLTPKRAMAN